MKNRFFLPSPSPPVCVWGGGGEKPPKIIQKQWKSRWQARQGKNTHTHVRFRERRGEGGSPTASPSIAMPLSQPKTKEGYIHKMNKYYKAHTRHTHIQAQMRSEQIAATQGEPAQCVR